MSPSPESSSSPANNNRLKAVNYANVVGYIINTAVVFGSTYVGLQDNATLSAKYQTLVTPAGYAFAIWAIIFTAELIWTVAQLFPAYRSSDLVTTGVGYKFVWACLAQALWTIMFGLEKIAFSVAAMILILIPLVWIVSAFSSLSANNIAQYWILKFPFEIHASWIIAATLVNINLLLVAESTSAKLQTIVGWASLGIVVVVGICYTLIRTWVVPLVLVWASAAIAYELSNPKDLITATFSAATIRQTQIAAGFVAAFLFTAILIKIVYDRFRGKPDNESNASSQYHAI
jgi:translocator protein